MAKAESLIHLSDLHVGHRKRERARTDRVFSWIGDHHEGVPVLITGDITHSGTRRQCQDALEMLSQLSKTNPVLTVPGNHDYGFLGITFQEKSWRNYYSFLAEPLGWPKTTRWSWLTLENKNFLGVLELNDIVIFGLDSCDPENEEACAKGWISKGLATRLQMELEEKKYSGKTRVVMLHHHPFKGSFLTELRGSKRLMQAVEGSCEVMIFGHHHHCGVWWEDRDIDLIIGSHKSTNRLFGGSMGIGLIEIDRSRTDEARFEFQIEAVGLELAAVA